MAAVGLLGNEFGGQYWSNTVAASLIVWTCAGVSLPLARAMDSTAKLVL